MTSKLYYVAILIALTAACTPTEEPAATAPAPTAVAPAHTMTPANVPAETGGAALTLVTDPSLVCMVNNQFMGRPQIPVVVDGKTYYGCCEMCKSRLATDATARLATDPFTGKTVDKSLAVVAQNERGVALYFENQETFTAYVRRLRR